MMNKIYFNFKKNDNSNNLFIYLCLLAEVFLSLYMRLEEESDSRRRAWRENRTESETGEGE